MKFYIKFGAAVAIIGILIWLLLEFGMGDSPQGTPTVAATTPSPVVTPAPTAVPVPVRSAVATPSLPDFIRNAATGAHVSITGARYVDEWWYVTVVGRDRNQLNDFLDQAMKMGLRNLDEKYQAYKQFVVRGEQRSQNTYKMKF